MKHKSDTKFAKWLEDHRYSDPAFAKALSEADPAGRYSVRSVTNWRRGLAAPRTRALEAMSRVNPEITPAMFVDPKDVAA